MKKFRTINAAFASLLVVALLLTAGCRAVAPEPPVCSASIYSTPENWFVSEHYSTLRPRRVVIATSQNRKGSFTVQEPFASRLAIELRNHGVSEAVVGGARINCSTNAIRNGRVDEYQLVQLGESFNADAVIYCDVVSISPYAPQQIAISLSMVDTRESVVLLTVDGVWDLRDEETVQSFKSFIHRDAGFFPNDSDNENLPKAREDDLYLQSPTDFISYVARDVAGFVGSAR